ncbi:hypothetical protein BC628DRAFT_1368472 [Trametes gibbosa]|nr:hypothetical protein BC628DRAFT_1368472 [Trametes gibbosa]
MPWTYNDHHKLELDRHLHSLTPDVSAREVQNDMGSSMLFGLHQFAIRTDTTPDELGELGIGIALPAILLGCAAIAIAHLIRRGLGGGRRITEYMAFIRLCFGQRSPSTTVSPKSSEHLTDALILRRTNTYRFLVAPPRSRPRSHCFPPSSRIENPFADVNAIPNVEISRPPSAILRSELDLDHLDPSIHRRSVTSFDDSSEQPSDERGAVDTQSSPRESIASFIGSSPSSTRPPTHCGGEPMSMESEDHGYLSDATVSTLPPSYRTKRATLPRAQIPAVPAVPLASTAGAITSPPSAFITRGRGRSKGHGPILPRGATQQLPTEGSILRHIDELTSQHDVSGMRMRRQGQAVRESPRRSADGGVRLAGGPLGSPEDASEGVSLYETPNIESEPLPIYKEQQHPVYYSEEKDGNTSAW